VFDDRGNYRPRWVDTKTILGVPHDIPIAGYGTKTVNLLRLWASKSTEDFDLAAFNRGGYVEAVREKAVGETVSKVLYPNDKTENGKELRLVQQYFFVACSLRDIIRRHLRTQPGNSWDNFADKVAVQLNDTHPAIAIVELHAHPVDEENMPWGRRLGHRHAHLRLHQPHAAARGAGEVERAAVRARAAAPPPDHLRHQRAPHAGGRAKWPGDNDKKRVCSLIEENGTSMVRMANLAVVGSHAVNGVAALHTALLKKHLFPEFDALYPGKFQNKTNGITPRRWLLKSNPRLAALITGSSAATPGCATSTCCAGWRNSPTTPPSSASSWRSSAPTRSTSPRHQGECGVEVSPDALFDVQIKRLHEYKRQHLNLLHILALYRRLLQNPSLDVVPRVFIFAAKAAPGYDLAKNIIRAINVIGARINADPRIGGKLKVAFLPNYRVSLAEKIIPAPTSPSRSPPPARRPRAPAT
jgi:starch phosphorylase